MAIQSLTDAYQYIGTTNIEFQRNKDRWQFLLESYEGGETYRNGNHLVRYQLETDGEYAARLRSTPLDNHCRSVISVYISFLFREKPSRELGVLESDASLEDFLKDADLDGRSFNSFMKEVSTWGSVFGHCWILMTKPNVVAQTLADQIAQGVRPYVNLLTPLTVTDWKWERQANGRYELVYFKYIEDVNDSVVTIREWTRDFIRTWQSNERKKEAQMTAEEVNGLGKIPAVIAYNQRSQVRGLGVSDISDIADQQRAIYNELSEVEQSIRLEGHPSLVTTPDTQIGSGAGALIQIPEGLDPGLKPYMLNADATPINMIYESIRNRISAIDKMANTGGVRATEARTASGIALETEFQLLNAKLSEKADNLELAEEQLWNLWCEYQGSTWSGEIEYPGSFNIRDVNREFEQLISAKSAATDPAVAAVIDYKLLEALGEEPDELMAIIDTLMPIEPASGQAVAQLMVESEGPAPYTLAQANSELAGEQQINGCPLPIMNKETNIINHQICISEANLGPGNPAAANPVFWIKKADLWNVSEAEARTRLCSNCGYYTNTTAIQGCFSASQAAGNLPLATDVDPTWTNTTDAAAYCLKWEITCTASRTCDSWAPGGPIVD